MTTPQTGICAEGSEFGIFLTLTVKDVPDAAAVVRRVAAELPSLVARTAADLAEPSLVGTIAFGAAVWARLYGAHKPAGLGPFPALAEGTRIAPATPADLFVHIRSARHDANFVLAREVRSRLGGAVTVVEEIHGFKYLGGRDLTGFVDGTENPQGEERAAAALVGAEDPDFAGGSHVSIQRYIHDMKLWEGMPLAEQEGIIGRTKADDEELDDAVKPATAHIARVVIEENGEELRILRHSLPYGTTGEHGLYFVAYGRSPEPFRKMLERMVLRDGEGHHDRLLDFTRAVTGASFFAPSVEFLQGAG